MSVISDPVCNPISYRKHSEIGELFVPSYYTAGSSHCKHHLIRKVMIFKVHDVFYTSCRGHRSQIQTTFMKQSMFFTKVFIGSGDNWHIRVYDFRYREITAVKHIWAPVSLIWCTLGQCLMFHPTWKACRHRSVMSNCDCDCSKYIANDSHHALRSGEWIWSRSYSLHHRCCSSLVST